MRAKTVGVFALGFAAGILFLFALLGSTGQLRTANGAQALPQIHLPGTLPDIRLADRIPKPAPEPFPLPFDPPSLASSQGAADRMAPSGPPGRLLMPIEGVDVNRLADSFNDSRDGQKHEALDIPAARGTPVHAAAEGTVVKLFTSKQGGLTVYQFDDSGAWCYYYAHLDHYARGISEGMLLRKGDVLGNVGSTGNAAPNAPHLHFAVFRLGPDKKWWQGQAINPLPLLK